jgi:hypothetical protein
MESITPEVIATQISLEEFNRIKELLDATKPGRVGVFSGYGLSIVRTNHPAFISNVCRPLVNA